jgi:hypothetical protein
MLIFYNIRTIYFYKIMINEKDEEDFNKIYENIRYKVLESNKV